MRGPRSVPNSLPELSLADQFRLLPPEERERRLAELDDREALALLHDWSWWARPSQVLPGPDVNLRTPDGSWVVWMCQAGRGWGKTRVGAETVRIWARDYRYVSLVGPTADDARDVMIEGESGILACCPKGERPYYRPSKRRLEWPNGSRSLVFTADEPERLRGKQHMKFWADEVGSWRYADSWDQLTFGLRLGNNPQGIVTSTPRPTKLIKDLIADPSTLITRGRTYDNGGNLAPTFLGKIIRKYEGTRLGRQELDAELLDDNPGALWKRNNIEQFRVRKMPATLLRIVVGVDPAVTSSEDSDETGIVVAGVDGQTPPHFYVLDDCSLSDSPDAWARAAVMAYLRQQADRIVGEVNNGGDLVESVIRHVVIDGQPAGQNASYKAVHASRGKAIRAEPIAALYEQGRVHHVGAMPVLEDQLCDWDPLTSLKSPDRLDALVWAITELSEGSGTTGILDFYRGQAQEAKGKQ